MIIKKILVDEQETQVTITPSLLITATAVTLGVALLFLGILPGTLLEMANSAIQTVLA